MSHIIEKKTSIYLEIILKNLEFFEKASHHFKYASIPLKMSSKSLKEPQISYKASIFLKMSSKSLTLIIKRLQFSENIFKKPQNRSKRLTLLEKASISLKIF
jgi:hypothetical protein